MAGLDWNNWINNFWRFMHVRFSDFQKHYFCLSSYSLMRNCLLLVEHFGVSTFMMGLLKGTYPVSSVRAQSKLFVGPWGCMNFHVTECSSFLLLFHDYWITFYNFTLWRSNFTHMSTLVIQTRKAKKIINFKFLWQICIQKEGLLKLSVTKICWQ